MTVIRLQAGGRESVLHEFDADTDPDEFDVLFALAKSTTTPADSVFEEAGSVASEQIGDLWHVKTVTPAYDLRSGGIAPGAYYLHRWLDGAEDPHAVVATVVVLGGDWD